MSLVISLRDADMNPPSEYKKYKETEDKTIQRAYDSKSRKYKKRGISATLIMKLMTWPRTCAFIPEDILFDSELGNIFSTNDSQRILTISGIIRKYINFRTILMG